MATDFIAGCLGGCAGVFAGHPLDTVKVHMQTQGRNVYRSTGHCIQQLVRKEGVRGLYRGMSSPLVGVAGINAIVFGVYGNTLRQMNDPASLRSTFLAGCAAGFVQSIVCSPMELAKSRSQVSGGKSVPLECLKRIHAQEGLRGVFKGLGITTAREVPSFGTYFLTYELLTRTEGNARCSTTKMLLSGGVAGCLSWIVVYPLDVTKSRFQIDGVFGAPKYTSTWDCFRCSVASEGYGFLMKGLTPTLLRAFPTNAACFTVVTWSMRVLSGEELQLEVFSMPEEFL